MRVRAQLPAPRRARVESLCVHAQRLGRIAVHAAAPFYPSCPASSWTRICAPSCRCRSCAACASCRRRRRRHPASHPRRPRCCCPSRRRHWTTTRCHQTRVPLRSSRSRQRCQRQPTACPPRAGQRALSDLRRQRTCRSQSRTLQAWRTRCRDPCATVAVGRGSSVAPSRRRVKPPVRVRWQRRRARGAAARPHGSRRLASRGPTRGRAPVRLLQHCALRRVADVRVALLQECLHASSGCLGTSSSTAHRRNARTTAHAHGGSGGGGGAPCTSPRAPAAAPPGASPPCSCRAGPARSPRRA